MLSSTLDAIARQTRLPDEIVISDSSQTDKAKQVVASFQAGNLHLQVKYVPSEYKTLPWHRWNAFQHSTGQVVFFMDDDITLIRQALQMLEQSYIELFSRHGANTIAGVGLYIVLDDGEKLRRLGSFEEKWLGISSLPSASITRGGMGIPAKSMPEDTLMEVGRLSGGAMSFRREVLKNIGHLDGLVDLFNRHIGPSEDAVLSYYARQFGRLFMLTHHLAVHPGELNAVHTVDARDGWHRGMLETWGRAHTMRWMSTNKSSYRQDWLRVSTLEILRSIWWGILRKPFSRASWSRLAGGLYGFLLTLWKWNTIPPTARLS
ncbi:MAG: glycosyltransferase [Anaerolineales bacterium]|nr:glycosyltransferase [Anaerolineales bacterium]